MALAAALAVLLFSCSREPAPRSDTDVVVAEVNGARITLKDLKNEIAARRGLSPSVSTKSAGRSEVQEALRLLIDRAVVLSEGDRLGVSVYGSEVEKEIDRFRADFPPGGLEKALLQAGMDMETWRAGLARSLLYGKVAAAIAEPRATVSKEEVEEVYNRRAKQQISLPERIRVRQFLFDSEESALSARKRIEEGESPEKIVDRLSTDGFRPTAADLGDVTREDLPPELASELFSLKEGGVSGVLKREQRYSIFVVVRREPPGKPLLSAVAPEIREELLRSRREEAFRSWLRAQVGKADIRIQEALLDQLAGGGK